MKCPPSPVNRDPSASSLRYQLSAASFPALTRYRELEVAAEPQLGPGMTSVGTAVSLEHRRASPVGAEITVEAELTEVDGRRLVFSFIVRQSSPGSGDPGQGDAEEDLVVGAGTVERVVVDRDKFLARAQTPVVDRG